MTTEVLMLNRLSTQFPLTVSACVGILLAGGLAPVFAQYPALEDLPIIEASYTQVLSTDSMGLGISALSPDGRWIVFVGFSGSEETRLWIVSANGGEPFPLTSGSAYDDGPVWFPESNRIAYRSGDHVASLAIDPSTGRPAGDPQRVTIEPSMAYFDISPDGKWIAYTPLDENGNRVIRVVPSNGGIARTVVEESTPRPAWAPDGRSIYYVTSQVGSPEETLMRVGVERGARAEGAEPEEVFTHLGYINTGTYPGSAFVWLGTGGEEERQVILTTLQGQPLGRLDLEKGMRPRSFSSDGRTLLVERRGGIAPLRIAPVAGGAPKTVQRTDSRPLAWTPDGERVLVRTALNGTDRLFLASVSGGVMTELRLPEPRADVGDAAMRFFLEHQPDPVFSADGRHLLYAVPGAAPDTRTLKILDVETGRATILPAAYPEPWGSVLGPGGTINRDEDEFFYWEEAGGDLVLRAGRPTGESRVLRNFGDLEESIDVTVQGPRIAYVTREGTRSSVLLADVGREEPETILTVDGFLGVLAWSPNGRWLAATHWSVDGREAKAMLIRVSGEGTVEGDPRYLGAGGLAWWGHQWLPDSSGFLTAGTQGDVWFIPVDPMAEPVSITEEEQGSITGFVLSPDGTHIAYAPWIPGGHSLWLIDLGDALTRTSR